MRVDADEGGSRGTRTRLFLSSGRQLSCDVLLVATGRAANVSGLDLDKAGVKFVDGSEQGGCVVVNDMLQTSNPCIYAVGDVATTSHKFTHAADTMARIVVNG